VVLVMLDFQVVLLEGGKFLGAFAKLQKAAVSFVMSVCMEQLGSHWTGLSLNLIFEYFLEIYQENSSFIEIRQE